eukprot:829904_1
MSTSIHVKASDINQWVHTPEGYIARFEDNISYNCIGLCTTQFTSCHPIIIIHKPQHSEDTIRASLIHFDDVLSADIIDKEIDAFIKDNHYVFIYRQLGYQNNWMRQFQKYLVSQKAQINDNYVIIDLPELNPHDDIDPHGFIGITFEDILKIRDIHNDQDIISHIKNKMVLLPIADRDRSIHKNPFFLIRHPNEFELRCKRTLIPSLDSLASTMNASIPLIFDHGHWVNIDRRTELEPESLQLIRRLRNTSKPPSFLKEVGTFFKQQSMSSSDEDSTIIDMVVTVRLIQNKFDLKELFLTYTEWFKTLCTKMTTAWLRNIVFGGRYQAIGNNTLETFCDKQNILDQICKMMDILKSESWTLQSRDIMSIAHWLTPFKALHGFLQMYSYILLYIYHSKLQDIKQSAVYYSGQGKQMYIEKQFGNAIGYFTESLNLGKICYVDPSLHLIRAYYNLGSAYYNDKCNAKAKNNLFIASEMCRSLKCLHPTKTERKAIDILCTKVENKLQDSILTLALFDMQNAPRLLT